MLAGCMENGNGFVRILLVYGNDHAHTHIKGIEHITLRNVTGSCDQIEDGQHLHCTAFDLCADALRQAPGNVLVEPAAGNVGNRLDIYLFQ